MERWIGKAAIVTGASSGLGADIAKALVKSGVLVVGIARRLERIQQNANDLINESGKLYPLKCDVTIESDIVHAYQWTTENIGPVHIVINAAGGNPGTEIINGNAENWKICLDTNVIGLSVSCREAIRIMLEANVDGHIINVNSQVGHEHVPLPTMDMYCASKHAITNICQLLRKNLSSHPTKNNIKVTSISPGPVYTEFINKETCPALELFAADKCSLHSEDVTNAIMYILGTPPRVHISELTILPYQGLK